MVYSSVQSLGRHVDLIPQFTSQPKLACLCLKTRRLDAVCLVGAALILITARGDT